jgi:hypothetical protein
MPASGEPLFEGAPALPEGFVSSIHASSWSAQGPEDRRDFVAALLRGQTEPLYALLDAARDPEVLRLIRGAGEPYWSLFPGEAGARMADSAPYLVRLPEGSPFLPALIRRGWGKSWGVYLVSQKPVERLVPALQFLLLVQDEAGGAMYFRYYDPRILRAFLPVATPRQADLFFAAVSAFLIEGKRKKTLLRLTRLAREEAR